MMDVESTVGSADEVRPFLKSGSCLLAVSRVRCCYKINMMLLWCSTHWSKARISSATVLWCVCRTVVTRFGYPNERELQTLMGAQLFPEGSGVYGIFEVRNSFWITEIEEQQRSGLPCAVTSSACVRRLRNPCALRESGVHPIGWDP